MRENYWNDESETTQTEKQFLRQILIEEGIFHKATLEDTKYFFFTLPSIIIVKAYAVGFHHEAVKNMLHQHIQNHRSTLMQRAELKIQYKL